MIGPVAIWPLKIPGCSLFRATPIKKSHEEMIKSAKPLE